MELLFLGENKYPPFDYIDVENEIKGFNSDITKAICTYMGLDYRIQLDDWKSIIDMTKENTDIVYQGMFYSKKREQFLKFSDEYLTVSHSFFSDKRNVSIQGIEDIKSKRVGIQEGALTHDLMIYMKNLINIDDIVVMKDHIEILERMFRREVDVIAGNRITIMYLANSLFKDHKIKTVGKPIEVAKLCYATSWENADIINLVNAGLEYIQNSGEFREIYNKWFGTMATKIDQQVIDYVDTAVVYVDVLGRIIGYNKAANTIFKLSQRGNEYIRESNLNRIIPYLTMQRVLDGNEENLTDNKKVVIDGKEMFFSYLATPIRDVTGKTNGAMFSIKDVTMEKVLKRRLKNYDKLQSLSRMIGGIAHEIKNPLTSIKSYVDLLPRLYDDEDFRKSLLANLPQQIEIINELVTDLLQYTSPKKPFLEVVKARDFADKTVKLLNVGNDIQIVNEIDCQLKLMIDRKNFRQILNNILMNAMEACKIDGKIILESAIEAEDYCIISITDNGVGIDKDVFDLVYEPFYTNKETGTGLGLFICHQLVMENNGSISISSEDNKTEVRLKFLRYKGDIDEKFDDSR